MKRNSKVLTVKKVDSLKEPGYYGDGGNLYLQISGTGSKSWLFIYRREGKKHEIGLGSLFILSLADAREKAEDYRKQLRKGINPLAEKRKADQARLLAKTKAITFKQCAELFIQKHQHELKNDKHIQQWQNTLRDYAFPFIGDLPVSVIDTALIMDCLNPIWTTKNETASRVRGRIEQVLSWATVSGYRTGDNPARWRGHLDKLLAKPNKVQNTRHHPALPYADMAAFMSELKQQDSLAARCLEFTLLTAARTNETIGATWGEIDLGAKVWTIPSDRMKADKEHLVPLSGACLALLKAMQAIKQNDYVFAGGRGGGLSNMAMLKLLERMGRKGLTVHGFRSTFRDWAAETTHHENFVLEMCLAHTIKNQAEAAYRRGDLLEKRLNIMNEWASYCHGENI
ncbi:integrase arm-type DNA-binding domain-containing protein [Methylovulum psychrotolerans]|uniref:tyrosine-type recombinase/integrase n=1 Tax=Methylovulum psychrotolerans TaxID=1704499 RepID=UPI001BFFC7CA|nr:integrase arm-type DNA-binding domain-containing protein [Methylovulum psychrotolerans]MBT9097659.1 integrase arm-type DNA-binding domain-containing protein [Methylovulum psychrotolerans]